MGECNGLIARHALVAERHRVGGEILVLVDGGIQIHGVREAEPERRDLFGMGGQQFGHGYKRVHPGNDSLCDVVHRIDLYGPFEATHDLVGVELRRVDIDRTYRTHFGQQRQRRRDDIGDIAVSGTVGVVGMVMDIDKPQVGRPNPTDTAQAHGLVEIVEVSTVQVFGRHAEGFDMELVAWSELTDKTVVIHHNNGLLNSGKVKSCLCSVTDVKDFSLNTYSIHYKDI